MLSISNPPTFTFHDELYFVYCRQWKANNLKRHTLWEQQQQLLPLSIAIDVSAPFRAATAQAHNESATSTTLAFEIIFSKNHMDGMCKTERYSVFNSSHKFNAAFYDAWIIQICPLHGMCANRSTSILSACSKHIKKSIFKILFKNHESISIFRKSDFYFR